MPVVVPTACRNSRNHTDCVETESSAVTMVENGLVVEGMPTKTNCRHHSYLASKPLVTRNMQDDGCILHLTRM